MKWLRSIFGSNTGFLSPKKYEKGNKAVIVLPPFSNGKDWLSRLNELLKGVNVFLMEDFSNMEQSVQRISKIVRKSDVNIHELAVLGYGNSGSHAYQVVNLLEQQGWDSKLILLDGAVKEGQVYSTDRTAQVLEDKMLHQYAKSSDINVTQEQELVKNGHPGELLSRIESDVYFFQSIGGIKSISPELELTNGKTYIFPINGHHFEILSDYLLQDLSFFISNALKDRPNLLVFTLMTQAATPNWYKDTEGRPMGEGKAKPSCKQDVAFEMKKCPYPGGRNKHEHPMNVSALKQMRTHWDEAIHLIRHLRDFYQTHHKNETWTLVDIWKITLYASYLPTFMLMRQEGRYLNHCVPPSVAAVYKMFIGLKAPIEHMVQEELLGNRSFTELNAEVIHDYAEEINAFVGPTEVCGGPKNLIMEFLNAFLQSDQSEPLKHVTWEQIVPNESACKEFMNVIVDFQILKRILLQQLQWKSKMYLPLVSNETVANNIRNDFHLNAAVLPVEQHPVIIGYLKTYIEGKNEFNFLSLENIKVQSKDEMKKLSDQMDEAFFNNMYKLESQLYQVLGLECKEFIPVPDSFVFIQYLGMAPFSHYIK